MGDIHITHQMTRPPACVVQMSQGVLVEFFFVGEFNRVIAAFALGKVAVQNMYGLTVVAVKFCGDKTFLSIGLRPEQNLW